MTLRGIRMPTASFRETVVDRDLEPQRAKAVKLREAG
jgi:hypothetical protein